MTGNRCTPSRLAGFVGLGMALLIAVAPTTASAFDYVALGDSYAAGTGTGEYYEGCERSVHSYSHKIDPQIPGDLKLIACGGAKTDAIPGQANQLSTGTDYATMSIGGNDAGFSQVLIDCGLPEVPFVSPNCDEAIDDAQDFIRDELPAKLNSVYSTIRSRAPGSRVTIVGYPRIFNGEDCNAGTFFSGGEMNRLNQTADLLADVTRARAQAHGFGFADARGAFLGHAVCDDTEWLNGLSNPTGESFHPNRLGHSNGVAGNGYAGIVRAALLAQESPAVARGPAGRIAFARGAPDNEDVFVINGNGSFPTNLPSNAAGSDVDPAFSADGTKLAFAGKRDGDYEIYVADSDGTDVQKLTSNTTEDREPTWSPNGDYLAFRSARDGNNEIYKMTAAGASQTRLTVNSDSEFSPAWSPDGAEIAYQRFGSQTGNQNDVWKMNSDGQGQTRLTTDGANDGAPEYSPNGTQIAFHSNRGGGDFEIYTMNPTGGSQTQRTNNAFDDERPAWSPNGASIVFSSDRHGDDEIYTMNSDGSSQTRRTTSPGADLNPTWQGDGTPPATEITAGPTGTVNTARPTFELDSNEEGSTFECRVDSGTYAACTSPHQTQTLSEGPHTFRARAIDPSGNVDASPTERTFTVEAPVATAITSGPSGPINEPIATFHFSAADPETVFTCFVDDVVVEQPCTSPLTTDSLPDGPHTFTVQGTDGVNTATDHSDFTVDTVAPDTSLASGPGAVTNQMRPSFELSSEEGSTYECRIDDGDFEPCASPYAPAVDLPDGNHTFRARATDPAGNAEVEPLLVGFAVDTEAPPVAIDDGPPAAATPPDPPVATNVTTPEFRFSSADGSSTFECRLDSLDEAEWAACETPFEPDAALLDGSHVFEVRALDLAGNAGEPANRSFVVDGTDPETTIVEGPEDGAPTNRESPAFIFESDDPDAEFECRLDPAGEADPWIHCEPGTPLGPLSENSHTFEVRAVDQVDNEDETPATRDFTVDLTPPETQIDSGPEAFTNDTTPSFAFSAESGDTFQCRVDEGEWSECTSPFVQDPPLANGPHTFAVRSLDPAGNVDPDPESSAFEVDTAAPVLTITGPAVTNDTTPTFALSANEPLGGSGAGFTCKVDSQAVPCTESLTTPPLGANTHTVQVYASDRAANAASATKTFVVDLTAPNTTITAGPDANALIKDSTPTFEFNGGGESDPRFECRVDVGPYELCGSPLTTGQLGDGPHSFEVRTLDLAGNADASPARRAFTVDTTAPRTTIDAGPRDVTRDQAPSFSFSSTDPTADFECSIDAAPFAACSSPFTPGPLAYGPHTFAVRAVDAGGNSEATPATRTFTVSPPANDFSFGKLKRSARRGTATLAVSLPGPGRLELSGRGLKRSTKSVSSAGTAKLKLVATGAAARTLKEDGAVKVMAKVRFTPDGGEGLTKPKRVKLLRG